SARTIDPTTSAIRPTKKKVTSLPIICASEGCAVRPRSPLLPRSVVVVRIDPVDVDRPECPRDPHRQLPLRGIPVTRVVGIAALDHAVGLESHEERVLPDLYADAAGDFQRKRTQ